MSSNSDTGTASCDGTLYAVNDSDDDDVQWDDLSIGPF
jgi:hypothetical protein